MRGVVLLALLVCLCTPVLAQKPGYDDVGAQTQAPLIGHPIDCRNSLFTGFLCRKGGEIEICPSGKYCPSVTEAYDCPAGSWCPNGMTHPWSCPPLSACAAGGFKYRWFLLPIIFVLIWVSIYIGLRVARRRERLRAAALPIKPTAVAPADGAGGPISINVRPAAATFELVWRDLTVEMRMTGDKKKTILHPSSGKFAANRIAAIMGSSGSGKTTFLNAISGRSGFTGGEVYLRADGQQFPLSDVKSVIGFVPQDDIMLTMMTVRDILTHSALTRLPASYPREKKLAIVERVIDILGLRKVADRVIGDDLNRGVSGGERKRVSIGMELVANPFVLFLDEPTSGLDAASAKDVATALKRVAQTGTIVITVIHQPRYEIFHMFDDVLLLSRGHQIYFGPSSQTEQFFAKQGYVAPAIGNPADFFMDVLSGVHGDASKLVPAVVLPPASPRAGDETDDKKDVEAAAGKMQVEPSQVKSQVAGELALSRETPSLLYLIWLELYRWMLLDSRAAGLVVLDTLLQMLPGLAMAFVIIDRDPYFPPLPLAVAELCPVMVRDACINDAIEGDYLRYNTFFTCMSLGATASIFAVRAFGKFRAVFLREQDSGANFWSITLATLLYDSLHAARVAFTFVAFYMFLSGARGTFGQWFLVIYFLTWAVFGMGYVVSVLVQWSRAMMIAVVVAVAWAVTSGLSPNLHVVDNWYPLTLIWHISYCRWASEAIVNITSGGQDNPRIRLAVKNLGYDNDRLGYDVGILLLIGLLWRVIAVLLLRRVANTRAHKQVKTAKAH